MRTRERSLLPMASGIVALVAVGVCGCRTDAPSPTAAASTPEASARTPTPPAPAPEYLPLLVEESQGKRRLFARAYIPASLAGRTVLMTLRSGLPRGLVEPRFAGKHAKTARVQVGRSQLELPVSTRIERQPSALGLPIAGILGADFLLEHSALLDLQRRLLVRYPSGTEMPTSAEWLELPSRVIGGLLVVDAQLDGKQVPLVLDTGLPSIVWLGQGRNPGDQPAVAKDLDRRPLRGSYGTVRFQSGGYARKVSAFRVRSFPALEATAARVGADLRGLLGLGAFSGRALCFRQGHVYVGPAPHRAVASGDGASTASPATPTGNGTRDSR